MFAAQQGGVPKVREHMRSAQGGRVHRVAMCTGWSCAQGGQQRHGLSYQLPFSGAWICLCPTYLWNHLCNYHICPTFGCVIGKIGFSEKVFKTLHASY